MKARHILIIMGVAVVLFFSVYGCQIIGPGYVGIKVNLYGENKGVQSYTLRTGAIWYNRFTEQIFDFPTYMQNMVWTQDLNEGSPADESITFNSSEGAVVNADVAVSYSLQQDKITSIFQELRKDAEYINHYYMRSKVRDAINRLASKVKVTEIYGEGKQKLLTEVKAELERELSNKGFNFDMVAFVGKLRVDARVEESINATISATQRAIEAQNKVVQSKAEADQKIEEARGEAESILLVAKAKAESNQILTQSLTPTLLQYEALQRWDGILPRVTSEAIPFITIGEK